ncbi:hypothetical protein T4C_4867 [Trichinella pseudospiralis]|uniref:Uncharacterized protein n=1 Tax=Trichinella pseudospiralis TaxID=6337 RepID=A0A0V1GD36_TRIPS|nr:hypothetical protein T4C_12848 [Trichinella pseudospiralis]KRY98755.1 hypothetical protein T4C_4867 [Trichinella pseudospiralis]
MKTTTLTNTSEKRHLFGLFLRLSSLKANLSAICL